MKLTDEKICEVYFAATGQSLREQDQRLAFAFARAILKEAGVEELVSELRAAMKEATGIYPAAMVGREGVKTERTERESGWNDAVIAMGGAVDKIEDILDVYEQK